MRVLQKRKKLLAAAGIAAVLGITIWLWRSVGTEMVRFISDPAVFREWVDLYEPYSHLGFLGMVIFQVLIAFIPGEPFEIAAGYAFGVLEGTVLCLLGACVGSILTFALVRRLGMKVVRIFFSEEQINSVSFLKSTPRRDLLFLLIYMIPGTPKDLLGYFAGLTDIRFPVWLLICTAGRLPSVITSVVGGNALGTENYWTAAIVFAATLTVSAVGLLAYGKICKKKTREKELI